jgi:hypothetical protein
MTQHTAQKVADIALAVAAVGAAYFIMRRPPLRRLALGLAVSGVTGGLPAWFSHELQRAWSESGQRSSSAAVQRPSSDSDRRAI